MECKNTNINRRDNRSNSVKIPRIRNELYQNELEHGSNLIKLKYAQRNLESPLSKVQVEKLLKERNINTITIHDSSGNNTTRNVSNVDLPNESNCSKINFPQDNILKKSHESIFERALNITSANRDESLRYLNEHYSSDIGAILYKHLISEGAKEKFLKPYKTIGSPKEEIKLAKAYTNIYYDLKDNDIIRDNVSKLSDLFNDLIANKKLITALANVSNNSDSNGEHASLLNANISKLFAYIAGMRKIVNAQCHDLDTANKITALFARDAVELLFKKHGDQISPIAIEQFLMSLSKYVDGEHTNCMRDIEFKDFISILRYAFGLYGHLPSHEPSPIARMLADYRIATSIITFGKRCFKIINTGSHYDSNCAFRALALTFAIASKRPADTNNYKLIKDLIVSGANKIIEPESDDRLLNNFVILLKEMHYLPNKLGNDAHVVDFLKDLIKYNRFAFSDGLNPLCYCLMAVGSGKLVVVLDGKQLVAYSPDGTVVKETNLNAEIPENTLTIAEIYGHSMALIPVNDDAINSVNTAKDILFGDIEKRVTNLASSKLTLPSENDIEAKFKKFSGLSASLSNKEMNGKAIGVTLNEPTAQFLAEKYFDMAGRSPLFWADFSNEFSSQKDEIEFWKKQLNETFKPVKNCAERFFDLCGNIMKLPVYGCDKPIGERNNFIQKYDLDRLRKTIDGIEERFLKGKDENLVSDIKKKSDEQIFDANEFDSRANYKRKILKSANEKYNKLAEEFSSFLGAIKDLENDGTLYTPKHRRSNYYYRTSVAENVLSEDYFNAVEPVRTSVNEILDLLGDIPRECVLDEDKVANLKNIKAVLECDKYYQVDFKELDDLLSKIGNNFIDEEKNKHLINTLESSFNEKMATSKKVQAQEDELKYKLHDFCYALEKLSEQRTKYMGVKYDEYKKNEQIFALKA